MGENERESAGGGSAVRVWPWKAAPVQRALPPLGRHAAPAGVQSDAQRTQGGGVRAESRGGAGHRGVRENGGAPAKAAVLVLAPTHPRPPASLSIPSLSPFSSIPPTTPFPQFHPGDKVGIGKDDTLFALEDGIVVFKASSVLKKVSVVPRELFVIPEGQRLQPGSRTAKRREAYTPRAAQREAVAAAAAVAAVRPAP